MNKNPSPKWTSELTNYLEKSGKNTFGIDLLVDGPNENKGSSIKLSRILDNDDGETVVRRILFELQSEAKSILKKKGYPTDIKDFGGGEENMLDGEAAYAWSMLIFIECLKKEHVENNDAARIFIYTMMLISAAIGVSSFDLFFQGLRNAVAINKSHTKGRLPGVVLAIEDLRLKNPDFQKKRKSIWDHLRKLEKQGTPWNLTKDGTRYEITFSDKDTLIHKEITKRGETTKTISKDTFRIHYCKH